MTLITADGTTQVSWWFMGAAALSLATAGIHVFAGAPEIMSPVLGSGLPAVVKGVVDVMWHHITALLILATAASVLAAWQPEWRKPVALLLGGQYILIGALFLGLGLLWFGSVWPMPQWVLFLATTGLMLIGLRTRIR